MPLKSVLGVAIVTGLLAACTRPAPPEPAAGTPAHSGSSTTKTGHYDVAADPAVQLATAVAEATRQQKPILMVVGGEWCSWCHILDNYVKTNSDVQAAWNDGYVTTFVNFSDENENKAFLSKYPKIDGYPHIFVLDSSGKLLHSQNTALLEEGRSYAKSKMLEFLARWRRT